MISFRCVFYGKVSVKNSETHGTIFINLGNLQTSLVNHMQNLLFEAYGFFDRVKPLFVDFELRAIYTTLYFEAVFIFGSHDFKPISNLELQNLIGESMRTRFHETFKIHVYDLKIGKENFLLFAKRNVKFRF